MNILMVADQYPPIIGGAERQAQKLSRGLCDRGHSVAVVTGRWWWDAAPYELDGSVEVERVSTLFSFGRIRGLRKYSRDVYARTLRDSLRRRLPDADVVHVHLMGTGALVAVEEAARFDVPVLVKETSSGLNNSFVGLEKVRHGKRVGRELLRQLRHVAVLNAQAEEDYRALPFEDLSIHRVANGVDLDGVGVRWSAGASKRILFMGRLKPVKGAVELLRGFARIADDVPGWILRICGDGEERGRLESLSRELGIEDRVEFMGATADPLVELAQCGLLAVPSRAEGMSNTILEAMAVGTPVVATAVGATPEMLSGGAGWLVEQGDVGAFGEALVDAIRNPDQRALSGRRARARAEARYSFDVVAASFEQVYERMICSVRSGARDRPVLMDELPRMGRRRGAP